MRHGLADDVVLGHPRTVGAERVDHRRAAAGHRAEQRRQQLRRELRERHDVLARDHEHVPLEHGSMVEERDDVGLVEHDTRALATGDDRAEHATVVGHASDLRRDGLTRGVAVEERHRDVGRGRGHERADAAHDHARHTDDDREDHRQRVAAAARPHDSRSRNRRGSSRGR